MKRWLLIVALLGIGIVGWTVPRETAPGGCVSVMIRPDSVYAMAFSCSGLVNDTMMWMAPSQHRRCAVRLRVNIEARSMEVARADCEVMAPAGAALRVARSPDPQRAR